MKTFRRPKKITNKKNNSSENDHQQEYSSQLLSIAQEGDTVFSTIDKNFDFLHSILGSGLGLIKGKFDILDAKVQAGVVFIESIADKKLISSQVIKPLLEWKVDYLGFDDFLLLIQSKFITVPNAKRSNQMKQVVDSLLNGDTVLFIDGVAAALIIPSREIEKRAIEKPENEVTVFGSKDSFIEDLETNCSMVIRRLPTHYLSFETFTIGVLSHTKVKLLWLDGIANTKLIEEARRRIARINIDAVNGIGVLAELIEDKPLSPFPKYRQTQRPDIVAKYLTDGHFAMFCSNSPFALVAPITFWDNFKTMDDYSERVLVSSYLRIIRYIAFLLGVLISPLYLSFVTYNHSIVPPSLAVSITTGREGVPFPSIVELLIMTVAISIIRESSVRIPGSVGYFLGTLSAVVIGQSAVIAGYVSASVIIVVATTSISIIAIGNTSFLYPTKLITIFLIILSGMFGMFGLVNGMLIIIWHLVSLESFGVPYLYPVVPFDLEGMKDTIIRAPFSIMKKRLRILAPYNRIRMNYKKQGGSNN